MAAELDLCFDSKNNRLEIRIRRCVFIYKKMRIYNNNKFSLLSAHHGRKKKVEKQINLSQHQQVHQENAKKDEKNSARTERLDHELLDLVLDRLDLGLEVGALVGGDRGRHDGAGHTAGTAKGGLGGNEHVGHVLVLAKEGKVEQNLEGLGVS